MIVIKTNMKELPTVCGECTEMFYDHASGMHYCSRTGDEIMHESEKLANCPLMKLSLNRHRLINYKELNTAMEIINEMRPIIPDYPVNMANKPIIPMGDTKEEQ